MGQLIQEGPGIRDGLYYKKIENGCVRVGNSVYEVSHLLPDMHVYISVKGPEVCIVGSDGCPVCLLDKIKNEARVPL